MEKSKNDFPKISLINVLAMVGVLVIMAAIAYGVSQIKTSTKDVAGSQSQTIAPVVSYAGRDDTNALALLKENAKVKTEDSSMGAFVTEINSIPNDQNHFWMFYVNGKQATVGADQFQTKKGDKIEWRFETIE